ncbi:O-antigen ligase family protein [Desulfobacula toluolica]|nr:O-antigen ligase family protein [Desulfobacula toluolica]
MADWMLIAMVFGWFVNVARERRGIIERSPVNAAVFLIVIYSVVNLIRGYTFMALPADINLTRLMAWKNYMILPLMYFITMNNLRDEKNIKLLIVCICLAMLAMDFNFYSTFRWIKAEHYSNDIRISGPFSFLGPNELGVFYSMYTFLLIGISYFMQDKKIKWLILFVSACNLYPILFSYSRAAYICMIAGLFLLGMIKDRKLLLLLVVLIIGYSYILPNSVVERIDSTFLGKATVIEESVTSNAIGIGGVSVDTVGRKELWDKAKIYFKDHLFIGIGFDTFRHVEGMITHSLYMKILAEQGLMGMLVFIIFIFVILRQGFILYLYAENSLYKGIGLGFFLCVSVHLVGSITGDQSLYYNLMLIYWVFMGIVAHLSSQLMVKRQS